MKQWIEVLVLGLDEENNTLTPEECFGSSGDRQNPIWITLCNNTGGCSDGYRASESTWLDQVKRMNDETGNCFPIQLAKSALYYLINHEDITLIEEPEDEDEDE